ncbi:hypothetical protein [Streptomyces sp. NPDC087294]|uniref:hypothetical protein n=1 Tax=Streptomyces sp. NPDC087294 TaxID=3365777 RepID=UPI0037F1907E
MNASAQITAAQQTLAASAAGLSTLDSRPTPADGRPRRFHLCRRHTLLLSLVTSSEQLALAHLADGEPDIAAALSELTEHYRLHAAHAAREAAASQPRTLRPTPSTRIPGRPWPGSIRPGT